MALAAIEKFFNSQIATYWFSEKINSRGPRLFVVVSVSMAAARLLNWLLTTRAISQIVSLMAFNANLWVAPEPKMIINPETPLANPIINSFILVSSLTKKG